MRWITLLTWIALIAWAIVGAPGDGEHGRELFGQLLVGDFEGVEPWVIVHFNLMGMWPWAFLALWNGERSQNGVPAWPFAALSFAAGFFALAPWVALGPADKTSSIDRRARWLQHPAFLGFVSLMTLGLLVGGIVAGDVGAWMDAFRTHNLVHVMALDFLALSGLATAWVWRREVLSGDRSVGWALAAGLLPVLGVLAYVGTHPRDVAE